MDFTVSTVNTDRFLMDYMTFGTGSRPLVILPGISLGSVVRLGAAVADAYVCLADTHTVYLFDRSRPMPEGFTVKQMADHTAQAMECLGLTDADVMGCSQGGMMALSLALCHPERVHRMVIASSQARPSRLSKSLMPQLAALAEQGEARAVVRQFCQRVYSADYRKQYAATFAAMEAAPVPSEDLRRLAVMARACLTFDVYGQLNEIRCPAMVIGAWNDRVLSSQSSVEMARRGHWPLYMYGRYGHAAYDEAPDFKQRIQHFFNQA